jgi:hypothetical protein
MKKHALILSALFFVFNLQAQIVDDKLVDDTIVTDGSYKPEYNKKYVISAWVKETIEGQLQMARYSNSAIKISTSNEGGRISLGGATLPNTIGTFYPKGEIIEGWQRIEGVFELESPIDVSASNAIVIELMNLSNAVEAGGNVMVYFDDVRVFPFHGNMKSFVYDPVTKKLMAELDENNYATFYEYDKEGGLVRVKKETEKGVYTIQETRSSNAKK